MGVQYDSDEAPPLAAGEQAAWFEPVEDPMVEHVVAKEDTLQMIALRYHTTASAVKQANGWISDDSFDFVAAGSTIKVPKAPVPPIDHAAAPAKDAKEEAIDAFMLFADCAVPRLRREEARYYLAEHAWDVRAAWEARRADVAWEAGQGVLSKDRKKKQ
eukprot:TRINITY_DN8466_c0_g1_i2.p1 TRINITY_DN8466_c0_g1~~TRINITY_DN8466_c0_g1_i2.p1  ORF type:complete len:159 (+),score=72.69 TRINITY_DN8466_c0_g1_i2:104-580(+)